MQKEDYILREIEKIGIMLQMMIKKLVVTREKLPEQFYNQLGDIKTNLAEMEFDLDLFLELNNQESSTYLSGFGTLNSRNIEYLGDLLKEMGTRSEPYMDKNCLNKAVYLYEYCNTTERTFSVERENKILELSKILALP